MIVVCKEVLKLKKKRNRNTRINIIEETFIKDYSTVQRQGVSDKENVPKKGYIVRVKGQITL